MTLIYIATHAREDVYEDVNRVLHKGQITPALFDTYLATIRHLQPAFIQAFQTKATTSSNQLERKLTDAYIINLIKDKNLTPEMRAAAIPYLEEAKTQVAYLGGLLKISPKPMQAALLQTFKQLNDQNAAETTLGMALDQKAENGLKAQALVSLGNQSADFCGEVSPLLQEEDDLLIETTLRYLCRWNDNETITSAVDQNVQKKETLALWQLCNGQPHQSRPQTDAQWEEAIGGEGKAEKGQLIFQYVNAQCQRCHTIEGWGGDFGPDLSHIGSRKSKDQLITAILQPTAEISPEWQGWFVTIREGQTHYGRQIDMGFDKVEIMLPTGEFVTFDTPKSFGMAPTSLMPEGLENMLAAVELNDLITYLMSLK